jgi:hypothetical protein
MLGIGELDQQHRLLVKLAHPLQLLQQAAALQRADEVRVSSSFDDDVISQDRVTTLKTAGTTLKPALTSASSRLDLKSRSSTTINHGPLGTGVSGRTPRDCKS